MSNDFDSMIGRISERLEALGITERAASLQATGKPDALRYIRTRRAMPGLRRLIAIARVLQTSSDYLLGLTDDPNPTGAQQEMMAGMDLFHDTAIAEMYYLKKNQISAESPIMNSGALSVESVVTESGEPAAVQMFALRSRVVGFFALPTWMNVEEFHGFLCGDNSMLPRFRKGELVVYSVSQAVEIGDYAVFRLEKSSADGDRPGLAFMLRQLVGIDGNDFILRQFSPDIRFRFPRNNVNEMNRVISLEDALTPHGKRAANID
ncbi:LexA family transcriptional regulator [Sphingomonas sp. OTU376]|uniref:LexA family transcriptional regulator n=1 Tax=Sphingomonas sp. OTU376 TaxID=3043863 RepID=UPI00313B84E9